VMLAYFQRFDKKKKKEGLSFMTKARLMGEGEGEKRNRDTFFGLPEKKGTLYVPPSKQPGRKGKGGGGKEKPTTTGRIKITREGGGREKKGSLLFCPHKERTGSKRDCS